MSVTRRDFVKQSSLVAASLAAAPRMRLADPVVQQGASDVALRQLCMFALDAAWAAGAEYADARVVRTRRQEVEVSQDLVSALQDMESVGVGIRVLIGGAWGFAASNQLTRPECVQLARFAAEQASANQKTGPRQVSLGPIDASPDGEWWSPVEIDPFEVSVGEKTALLMAANREALRVDGVWLASSAIACERVDTTFASTAGSLISQHAYRTYPSMEVTAISPDGSDFQVRSSTEVAPMGLGYEHVLDADLEGHARGWAEQAVEKLSATSVEPGEYDLILLPSNLFLTIHETIGRPTELDRALGYEAGYAGTSFLSPPEAVLGTFQYGPEFMNVQADRTQRGALATIGWDDEGVTADSWPIVRDGVLVDYQTTREQASWIASLTDNEYSHGCAHAESWDQVPFQRMPNISLLPGEYDHVVEDLIAATTRGILVEGAGPYSIDQQRYNFQFGGQLFHEVRDGALVGMLRDVAYVGDTPGFWNSLDMLGGPRSYELGGTLSDFKGQPAQVSAVSHGSPVARFKGVQVINTGPVA
jgi:TldD protein